MDSAAELPDATVTAFVSKFACRASHVEPLVRALFEPHGSIVRVEFTEHNEALVVYGDAAALESCLAAYEIDAAEFTLHSKPPKQLRVCRARGGTKRKREGQSRRSQKREEQKKALSKAQLCHAWATPASCALGAACRFAHGKDERDAAEREIAGAKASKLGVLLSHQAVVRARLEERRAAAPDSAVAATPGRRVRARRPPTIFEREYAPRFAVDVDGVDESCHDQYVQFHFIYRYMLCESC